MKTRTFVAGLVAGWSLTLPLAASPQTAKEEEAFDARLGLAEKPFAVNLVALKTRTELRKKAQIRTGLPSYDQQVETAQSAPAALLESLTRIDPASAPSSRSSRRTPPPPPPPPDEKPNCYIDANNALICD
jgi:hypothetical protein